MPGKYDGDIKLGIDLEASDAVVTAQELKKDITSVFKQAEGYDISEPFKKALITANTLVTKSSEIQRKMQELSEQKVYSEEYNLLLKELEKITTQYATINNRMHKFKELGGKTTSKSFKGMQYDLQNAKEQMDAIHAGLLEMRESGTAFVNGVDTQQYKDLSNQLTDINNKLTISDAKLHEFGNAELPISAFETVQNMITKIRDGIEHLPKNLAVLAINIAKVGYQFGKWAATHAVDFIKRVGSAALNAAKSLGKLAVNAAKVAGSAVRTGISKLRGLLNGLHKSTNNASKGFNKGFKTILKYGLGIRSVYMLVRKLRSAITEGFTNLGKAFPEIGQQLSTFKNALGQLKNSFAGAFAPIAQIVLPILTRLVNGLNTAINKVGEFIAAITGKSTYIKAIASTQNDYADAIDNTGDAAKKAEKNLAGFDDVQILKDPNASGSGGGSGSSAQDPSSMFETAPVTSAISDFAEELRKRFEKQDWEGVGELLAQKVNSVFTIANNAISSGALEQKLTTATNAIAGILNGLIANIDADAIGKLFSGLVNIIVSAAQNLLNKADFNTPASKIATAINSLATGIKWENIGTLVATWINKMTSAYTTFIKQTQWETIANGIVTAVNKLNTDINWENIGKLFGEGVNAIATTINTLSKIDFNGIGTNISTGVNSFAATTQWTNVGKAFGNGFKAIFDVVNGLVDPEKGINWKQLGEDVAEGVEGFNASGVWDSVQQTFSGGINAIVQLCSGFLGRINFAESGQGLGKKVNDFFADINWEELGQTLDTGIQGALDFLVNAVETIDWVQIGEDVKEAIKQIDWDAVFSKLSELIGAAFGALAGFIWGIFKDAYKQVVDWWNSNALDEEGNFTIEGLFQGIIDAFKNIGSWIKEHIFDPFIEGFKSIFKIDSPSKVMEELGGYIIDGLFGGIKTAWESVTKWFDDVLGAVSEWVNKILEKVGLVKRDENGYVTEVFGKGVQVNDDGTQDILASIFGKDTPTVETDVEVEVLDVDPANKEAATSKLMNLVETIKKPFVDTDWKGIGKGVLDALATGVDDLSTVQTGFQTGVDNSKATLADKNANFSGSGKNAAEAVNKGANTGGSALSAFVSTIGTGVTNAKAKITGFLGKGQTAASDLNKGVGGDTQTPLSNFVSSISTGITNAKAKITGFKGKGETTAKDLNTGVGGDTKTPLSGFVSSVATGITNAKAKITGFESKGQTAASDLVAGMGKEDTNISKKSSAQAGLITSGYSAASSQVAGTSKGLNGKGIAYNIAHGLVDGMSKQNKEISDTASGQAGRVTKEYTEKASNKTNSIGNTTANNFVNGMYGQNQNITDTTSWLAALALQQYNNVKKSTPGIGEDATTDLADGMVKPGVIQHLKNRVEEAIRNIPEKARKYLQISSPSAVMANDVGQYVTLGIAEGLVKPSAIKALKDRIAATIKGIPELAKEYAEISSPSKLMRDEVGQYLTLGIAEGILDEKSSAIGAMESVLESVTSLEPSAMKLPDIVAGNIVPYGIGKSSSQQDMLQTMASMIRADNERITRDTLTQILEDVISRYLNISFYMGDEEVARHVNAGNDILNRRYSPVVSQA